MQKIKKDNKFLFDNDSKIREKYPVFCGIDEAGRGPLAGDVFAAAVILPEGLLLEGLDDSKKITEKTRERLFDEIMEKAVSVGIGRASNEEIDRLNILNASMLAMKRAFDALSEKPAYFLADGNKLPPDISVPGEAVVKGDGTYASIAAASVIAKVSRDRYMKEMAEKYPEYAFEKHKGYATKLHYEKIREYGITEIHRKTFLRKMH